MAAETDIEAQQTVAEMNNKAPRTAVETDIKAPRTVAETNNKTTRTEEASEVATEAAAAEQQATAEEQRPQSGRPTTRSWEAEDV